MDVQTGTLCQASNGSPSSPESSNREIVFQRRLRTDHIMLCFPKALKTTRCESIKTTIHKRQLFFAEGVARESKERLPSGVMFGTM
ncbi:hypothetical protein, partial [Rhodopirellula bahusiensis]|uniref:hypothetical protein n=1 Tax=Rhodopirellula bahusiensis TaxID=2014065 RepID=UPI00326448E6